MCHLDLMLKMGGNDHLKLNIRSAVSHNIMYKVLLGKPSTTQHACFCVFEVQ